jgi:uncharacterized protein YceK
MKKTALLMAICAPLVAGCGTFADAFAGPADDHLYYRGVRMDVAAVKSGVPIMALDLPLSACADTLLIPSIAYRQITEPEAKHRSVVQAAGEGMTKAMVNDVMVPMTNEMMKADADRRIQQPMPAAAAVSYQP